MVIGMTTAQQQEPESVATPSLEAARFEFEKALEASKLELEKRKLKQARVDTWTKFVSTIGVGVVVAGGLQLYSNAEATVSRSRDEEAHKVQAERAASAQKAQIAIELTSSREKALSDLRASMFNALLQHYFKQADDRERIAILELMALNFRDAVQIRPMLELLQIQLREKHGVHDAQILSAELWRAAHRIVRDQLEQIRQTKEGEVCNLTIMIGQVAHSDCFPLLAMRLQKVVDQSKINLQINVENGKLLDQTHFNEGFEVSYFDTPMIDYTTVRAENSKGWRYAIVLHKVSADEMSAEIGVALLPTTPVDAERRYSFDELLGDFLNPEIPASN